MANYKTKNIEIISAVTLGEVKPEIVNVANIDTSVKSLLALNTYQGQDKSYSGEIVDMSYKSLQDVRSMSDENKKKIEQLKDRYKHDINYPPEDPTFP